MKAEEAFEHTVRSVFGNITWTEIQESYGEVLSNREKEAKCGKYGDDLATIRLMLYLREKMRESNLTSKKSIGTKDIEAFFADKGNFLTGEYKERFPISWRSEPKVRHDREYTVDGWDYSIIDNVNSKTEWIVENTHYYYNQLDHYLTYLTGAIRRKENAQDRIRKGANIKKDLCCAETEANAD